jgi:hypothetical protein
VDKGCLGKGCSDSREMHGLPVGGTVEGELHLSWMQMFPSPFMPFVFKKLARRHCPGMVTSGRNVTHKNFTGMRRLARDENPFLLVMPPVIAQFVVKVENG